MARHGAGWVCHWRGLCAERMSGCTVARLVRTAPQAFLKSTTQAECTTGTTGTQATKHVMAQPCAGATEDLRLASPVCCLALCEHGVWVPYPLGQRTCCYHHINLTEDSWPQSTHATCKQSPHGTTNCASGATRHTALLNQTPHAVPWCTSAPSTALLHAGKALLSSWSVHAGL